MEKPPSDMISLSVTINRITTSKNARTHKTCSSTNPILLRNMIFHKISDRVVLLFTTNRLANVCIFESVEIVAEDKNYLLYTANVTDMVKKKKSNVQEDSLSYLCNLGKENQAKPNQSPTKSYTEYVSFQRH